MRPADNTPTSFYYPPATDIQIALHEDPATIITPVRESTNYDTANIIVTDPATGNVRPGVETGNITAPAFVLISHGPNGRGAFLAQDNAGQYETDPVYTLERENWEHSANRLYYTGGQNRTQNPATHFDDIVLWMTQDGIMAVKGTSSCQYP